MRYVALLVVILSPTIVFAQQTPSTFRDLAIEPEQESDSYERSDRPHWNDADDDDDEDTRVELLIVESLIPPTVEERNSKRRVTTIRG